MISFFSSGFHQFQHAWLWIFSQQIKTKPVHQRTSTHITRHFQISADCHYKHHSSPEQNVKSHHCGPSLTVLSFVSAMSCNSASPLFWSGSNSHIILHFFPNSRHHCLYQSLEQPNPPSLFVQQSPVLQPSLQFYWIQPQPPVPTSETSPSSITGRSTQSSSTFWAQACEPKSRPGRQCKVQHLCCADFTMFLHS